MNKSQRIHLNINETNFDKHVFVKLEQNVETLEFLTMNISARDFYQNFNADYGVLVGRVIANGGVGVPNAKISIFIPVDDADYNNSAIRSIYPYKTPRDTNYEGKRYNLLPRVGKENSDGTIKPNQPFGSFPTKEEILTNETYLSVYEKYYKFSTITNDAGDYMIFGIPTGTQTVHMSVDITDIGTYSMTPAAMVTNLGYSPNLFIDNASKIKPSNDLSDLPNIETQEISVDVIPFWGDTENFEIGITRQDFRIRAEIKANAVIFGTIGTMGVTSVLGSPARDRRFGFDLLSPDVNINTDIRTLRGSNNLNIRLFTYTNNVSKEDIEHDLSLNIFTYNNIDDYNDDTIVNTTTNIIELDKNEYYSYIDNGSFVIVVPCNRNKIIKDEFNNIIPVSDDSDKGIFTKFLGMILVDYNNDSDLEIIQNHNGDTYYGKDKPQNTRGIIKIPQSEYTLYPEVDVNDRDITQISEVKRKIYSDKWRKTFFELEYSQFYSIAQFFPIRDYDSRNTNNLSDNNKIINGRISGFLFKVSGIDYLKNEYKYVYDLKNQLTDLGGTLPPNVSGSTELNKISIYEYEFPHNKSNVIRTYKDNGVTISISEKYFGGQWINMFMLLPQFSYAKDYTTYGDNRYMMVSPMLFSDNKYDYKNDYYLEHRKNSNTQKIFAGLVGTTNIIRADTFKTAIIKVPKEHITRFLRPDVTKNINFGDDNMFSLINSDRYNIYKYEFPNNSSSDTEYNTAYDDVQRGPYIFRGFYDNDCIKMLSDFNLI